MSSRSVTEIVSVEVVVAFSSEDPEALRKVRSLDLGLEAHLTCAPSPEKDKLNPSVSKAFPGIYLDQGRNSPPSGPVNRSPAHRRSMSEASEGSGSASPGSETRT